MKSLLRVVMVFGLVFAGSARSSSYKMRSCTIKNHQGGGQVAVRSFSAGESIDIAAKENGQGYLDISLSRALNELGLIGPLDLVTGLTYTPNSKYCTLDDRLDEVSCQENATEMSITTVQTDNNGITHERGRDLKLDAVNLDIHRGEKGELWDLSFQSNGKWVAIPSLRLLNCLYGEEDSGR